MAAAAPVAALAPTMPTGKPTNADFPSAASTPPVNIMTPEPGTGAGGAARAGAGECAAAVTAPGIDHGDRAGSTGGGQEAARAEIRARCAGPAGASAAAAPRRPTNE